MVRGFRLVVSGVRTRVGECRSVRSIVAVYLVAVGERHGSAVYALSRRDDRCNLCLAGVIRAGCFHGNGQLRRFDLDGHSSGRSRVFLVARSRGERPRSRIVASCAGFGFRVRPRERALDLFSGAGVFHRAGGRKLTFVQRLTVGDLRCADGDARCIEGDPCANDDLDGKLELLIVRGHNRDGYRADLCVNI